MIEKQYEITAAEGLHARPTSVLVSGMTNFTSDITLTYNDREANMKSLLGVMSLGIPAGSTIKVSADGDDEKEVIAKVDEIMSAEGIGN